MPAINEFCIKALFFFYIFTTSYNYVKKQAKLENIYL